MITVIFLKNFLSEPKKILFRGKFILKKGGIRGGVIYKDLGGLAKSNGREIPNRWGKESYLSR
jgi:hypothetical protein